MIPEEQSGGGEEEAVEGEKEDTQSDSYSSSSSYYSYETDVIFDGNFDAILISVQNLFHHASEAETLRMLFVTFSGQWQRDETIRDAVLGNIDNIFGHVELPKTRAINALKFIIDEMRVVFALEGMFDNCEPGYVLTSLIRAAGEYVEEEINYVWKPTENKTQTAVAQLFIELFLPVEGVERKRALYKAILLAARECCWLLNEEMFNMLALYISPADAGKAREHMIHCRALHNCDKRITFLENNWTLQTS